MPAAEPGGGGYTAIVGRLAARRRRRRGVARDRAPDSPPEEILVLDDGASFRSARAAMPSPIAPASGWSPFPRDTPPLPATPPCATCARRSSSSSSPASTCAPSTRPEALAVLANPRRRPSSLRPGRSRSRAWRARCEGGTTLADLLADPEAVHGAALFSRSAWEAAGGFDESLPELEDYELFLRLAASGREGVAAGRAAGLVRCVGLVRVAAARGPVPIPPRPASGVRPAPTALRGEPGRLAPRPGAAGAAALGPLPRSCRRGTKRSRPRRPSCAGASRRPPPSCVPAAVPPWTGETSAASSPSIPTGATRGASRWIGTTSSASWPTTPRTSRGSCWKCRRTTTRGAFGGDRVERSEVLDVEPGNPHATVVDDLRTAAMLPADAYDCIILTQTLHVIDDMEAVLAQVPPRAAPGRRPPGHAALRQPGLPRVRPRRATSGASPRRARGTSSAPRSGTRRSARARTATFSPAPPSSTGSAPASCGTRSSPSSIPFNPTLIAVRAQKTGPPAGAGRRRSPQRGEQRGLVLLYHRVADEAADLHHLCVRPETFAAQMRSPGPARASDAARGAGGAGGRLRPSRARGRGHLRRRVRGCAVRGRARPRRRRCSGDLLRLLGAARRRPRVLVGHPRTCADGSRERAALAPRASRRPRGGAAAYRSRRAPPGARPPPRSPGSSGARRAARGDAPGHGPAPRARDPGAEAAAPGGRRAPAGRGRRPCRRRARACTISRCPTRPKRSYARK